MNKQPKNNHAQMAVDFLIGMSLFIGIIVLTFQFMGTTIQPFTQSAYEPTIMVHSGADQLQFDKLATDETGVWNLNYLEGVDNDELRVLLGLNRTDRFYNFNITVREEHLSDGDIVEINGKKLKFGRPIPNAGPQVAKATRMGVAKNQNENVTLRVNIW